MTQVRMKILNKNVEHYVTMTVKVVEFLYLNLNVASVLHFLSGMAAFVHLYQRENFLCVCVFMHELICDHCSINDTTNAL